jgi:hypothetical protein
MIENTHPLTIAFSALAPIVGANFVLSSSRDRQIDVNKYPLIEYVVHKEGLSGYDQTKKSWRVELVVQIDYLLEEVNFMQCLKTSVEELEESQAVQGIQFSLTSKLRSLIQFIVDPSSLGSGYSKADFLWGKYDPKLIKFVESNYFRNHGSDELSGVQSLVVISVLDVDNILCCALNDLQLLYNTMNPESNKAKLLKQKIDSQL